jgi:copper chaperone CopZ
MSMIELALNDIACTSCIGKIKKGIKKYNGVEKVRILSGIGKMQINFNETIIPVEEINRSIHKLSIRTFD